MRHDAVPQDLERRATASRGLGGTIVAVVGSDGSGKSTAVATIFDDLSRQVAVDRIHMGKPPWSLLSRLIRRPMRKAREFGLFESTRLPPWTDFEARGFPGYGYLLWHLLIARDRYLQYRRARKASGLGRTVISDRWPLADLKLMDGPRLQAVAGCESRFVASQLCRRERWYYQAILPPDHVIVLRVTPELAAARRSDDSEEFIRRRATEVNHTSWPATGTTIVDADQPLESVREEVVRVVRTSVLPDIPGR